MFHFGHASLDFRNIDFKGMIKFAFIQLFYLNMNIFIRLIMTTLNTLFLALPRLYVTTLFFVNQELIKDYPVLQ